MLQKYIHLSDINFVNSKQFHNISFLAFKKTPLLFMVLVEVLDLMHDSQCR